MALQGINLPLAFTGQEAIWQKVFQVISFSPLFFHPCFCLVKNNEQINGFFVSHQCVVYPLAEI